MTMGTVFSNTVFMCCFLFPLCYEWPIRALNPLQILDSIHLYYLLTFVIVEINECEKKDLCGSVAECEDIFGSYKCKCPHGFSYDKTEKKCFGEKHCTF